MYNIELVIGDHSNERYSKEIKSLFGNRIDYTGASYSIEGPFNVYS